jgi:hypothetical protein
MKNYDRLYHKYAIVSPLLPPSPEEEEEAEEIEEQLIIPKFEAPPVIKDLSPEEMEQWDDFVAVKKRKKERMQDYLGQEEKLEKELGTIPAVPAKKQSDLSPDSLLKMCSKFYDLCIKF